MASGKPAHPREPFPGGSGRPGAEELRIAVERAPYAQIMSHARENADVEVCGVLVGRVKEDEHGPWLHVTHIVRGEGAEHKGNQVTFTHDAWNHIHKAMDAEHADRVMLGWYHTHPDYGIFLSEMDQFIHANFFTEPHHVAYVYDPLAGTEGFFHRRDGKFLRGERYWMGCKERRVVAAPARDAQDDAPGGAGLAALDRRLQSIEMLSAASRSERGTQGLILLVAAVAAVVVLGQFLLGGGGGSRAMQLPEIPVVVDPATGRVFRMEFVPTELTWEQLREAMKEEAARRAAEKKNSGDKPK